MTAMSIEGDVARANTFDEGTLRRIFPDAPAQLDVPTSASSLLKARLQTFGGDNAIVVRIAFAGATAIGLALAMASSELGVAILVATFFAAAAIVWVQHSRASDDFFGRYAAARGLHHEEDGHVGGGVPLLRRGDRRKYPRVLSGTIAGQPASLAHFTYTEASHDSEGDRDETSFDFTVLHFRLPQPVAERFKGVYCSPRGISLGALQDKLAHDRQVNLESVEFHERYSLRVVDEQDDIALYELFSPPFVHRLATELRVHWEQCGQDLVVWSTGHESDAANLDRFCLEAWHVLHRYFEEWR